jgi:hypothetical protein
MPFNLSEFRSGINSHKFGGLNKTNRFYTILDAPSGITRKYLPALTSREIQLFCDSIAIPQKSLARMPVKMQGYGQITEMPMGREASTLTASFMIDSKYQILKFFHAWNDYIVENTNEPPSSDLENGRHYREIAYKEDYTVDITVRALNDLGSDRGSPFSQDRFIPRFGDILGGLLEGGSGMEITFYDAYPINIGEVAMSWADTDTIMRAGVEFSFSHYTSKLMGSPNPRSLSKTGLGLLDSILEIKSVASTIINTPRPRNIQDVIDTVTTSQTIFSQF